MKDARLAASLSVPQWVNKEKRIPDASAYTPIANDPEENTYLISFRYYREDLCEIKSLFKNRGREGLTALKRIGQSTYRNLYNNGINSSPVENAGEYSKLFSKRLSPDVNMKEHKLQGESRIFFFTEGINFNIVAIADIHIETNKHR